MFYQSVVELLHNENMTILPYNLLSLFITHLLICCILCLFVMTRFAVSGIRDESYNCT